MILTFQEGHKGKKFKIEANESDTLESLIPKIAEYLGIQDKLNNIHITIGSKSLDTSKKIKSLPLKSKTVLSVITQPRSESPQQPSLSQPNFSPDFPLNTPPKQNLTPDTPSVSKKTSNKLLSKIPILPARASVPDNVDELVSTIVSLGFSEERSKWALQLSYYNIELALNYLLDYEKVPELPEVPYDLSTYEFEQFKQKISINEVEFGGIRASDYELTSQEAKQIYALEKKGFDREFIVQLYFSLNRDWDQTICTLESMAINS